MRNKITRITRTEFLQYSKAKFHAAVTKSIIPGGFRGAALVPHNLELLTTLCDGLCIS